jgi:UDP-2,3-diacylglucosamine pyrophosphatase LpxH
VDNGPIIAISDTHIGLQQGSAVRLAHFLEWLKKGLNAGTLPIYTSNGESKNLRPPEKLILVGDFFDLWGPRAADYTIPIKDGYGILDSLFHLPCDKIYIPGNHDDVASRYSGIDARQNGHSLTVVPKHYPQQKEGLQIGSLTYFFIHGHQFSLWRAGVVLKFFDFFGRFSYESYEVSPQTLRVGFIVFLLSLIGSIIFLFSLAFAPLYAILSQWTSVLGKLPVLVTALLAVVWVILCIFGLAFVWRKLQLAWNLIHPPHGFRFMESRVFNLLIGKPKYRDIGELINGRYYRQGKDTVKADVIVFGHTHVPELSPALEAAKGKMFVNTGSWIEGTFFQYDTFAYIDEEGPQLLQWDDDAQTALEFKER